MNTNKNVQGVANMFGSKPYTTTTNPSNSKNDDNTFQHLINGEEVLDVDKKVLDGKRLDTAEMLKDIEKPVENVKTGAITKIQKFITRKILPKVSKRINSINSLSESLDTLTDINKNIDDIIKSKTAGAESIQNYEKLASYLTRANKLQSHIIKSMNGIK